MRVLEGRLCRCLALILPSIFALAVCGPSARAQTVSPSTLNRPSPEPQPIAKGTVVQFEFEGSVVWRAEDGPFTLRALANAVAPILWFSPDEPLLRGGWALPQPLPHTTSAPPNDHRVVYYTIPLVMLRDDPTCAALAAPRGAPPLDLVWIDTYGAAPVKAHPPLDCLQEIKIRFLFYYPSEVGVGAHVNDVESVQVNVAIERNRALRNGSASCAETIDVQTHCASVSGIFGSAHGIAWYTNGLNVARNRDTLFPFTVLVEEGKHATAPDRNGDGQYTPGFDVDVHPNDAWGIRDVLRTRSLPGPGFRADMAKARRPQERVFPPAPTPRLLADWTNRMPAESAWDRARSYELVTMSEARAVLPDGRVVAYCDAGSDRLSPSIPDDVGCTYDMACEPLKDAIGGEEGCRRTRVSPYGALYKLERFFSRINAGGAHDEYLSWKRFFRERTLPSWRISGRVNGLSWTVPIGWNVPGLDGWVSARLNVLRQTFASEPSESVVDVVYSLAAARYFSLYGAIGADTLPQADATDPGKHTPALEAGFKYRLAIPKIDLFSGVRVGVRVDDPSRIRYGRLIIEMGGGSW
jgi:hypothetical protein